MADFEPYPWKWPFFSKVPVTRWPTPETVHPWEEFMAHDTLDPDYYEPPEE